MTRPTYAGGLGFGFKWNMGWMNDTLRYLSSEPVHRKWRHSELTFGLLYAFTENFVLPISHDEVVHGKGAVVGKIPGDEWRRFATARAYYGFMWGHPGKKLLFMGQEFGQTGEWNFASSLDWWLLDFPPHRGLQVFIRDLNRIYRENEALYARDCEAEGFQWIVADDAESSVFAFSRFGADRSRAIVVVTNFTPVTRSAYRLGLPRDGDAGANSSIPTPRSMAARALAIAAPFDARAERFRDFPASADILLPPLSTFSSHSKAMN